MQKGGDIRGYWASRMGFILAASGSAVGLGNVWKFPYITGQNGGGAFVVIYLVCVLIVGLPIMLAEFTIGRHTHLNPVGAFRRLSKNSVWVWAGYMGVLAGFLILSFYGVVGGWTLAYVVKSLTATVTHFDSPREAGLFFNVFISNSVEVIIYQFLFMAICLGIVIKGVHAGIEKACKILMPTLVVMLVILMARVLVLEGAMEGVAFYLSPDFSKITPRVILVALGQAFFSLSLGMGCMITYGSYLSAQDNLTSSTILVVLFDTIIALLMGMVIFPAVFAMDLRPTEGPSLVFSVLPSVFAMMPMGEVVSIIFFILLTIAAITSGISLLEVVVAYFVDDRGWPRRKAVIVATLAIFLFGVPSGFSFGIMADARLFEMTFFDHVDNIASNYFLPIGGMLTALFIGWIWGVKEAKREIEKNQTRFYWVNQWGLLIRYASPLAVALIFINKLFF
tara:strand:+ start:1663 stop:3015 length:1353 start_codon:yes stop_codon:yes gene_type:complete